MPEFSSADYKHIERALELAMMPVSAPHPNPRVGCVIVRNQQVVGEGFHRKAGLAHAEVNALDSCGDLARGGVMYVTLEPCNIDGRTPPCVDRLMRSGVKKVVICSNDPNPSVDGQGIELLEQAGIETAVGIADDKARSINRGYFSRHERGRPWLTVKVATSLDGRIAAENGESAWISGEVSRQDVQQLRAQASAILTGIGTVLADNPRLSCRAPGADSNPARIVVDSKLRIQPDCRLFETDGPVVIATEIGARSRYRTKLEESAQIVELPSGRGGLDCMALLEYMFERELNEILVEAGPGLVGSLLGEGLVDEMIFYMAPSLIGDKGRGIAKLPDIAKLSDRIMAEFTDIRHMGDDLRISVGLGRTGDD